MSKVQMGTSSIWSWTSARRTPSLAKQECVRVCDASWLRDYQRVPGRRYQRLQGFQTRARPAHSSEASM